MTLPGRPPRSLQRQSAFWRSPRLSKSWSGARDLNPGLTVPNSENSRPESLEKIDFSSILPVDQARTVRIWMNLLADYYMKYYTQSGPARRSYYAPARPRNTTMARPSRTMSSSLSRPIRPASLARWTVVILSTMMLLCSRRPFAAVGSIASRIKGASVGSVVNAQIVMESVASKRSSWIRMTGRGLPV
jgi:hypothetical protein